MPALLLVGLLSTIAQVVLLRELTVAAFGVELVVILALGAWLFWVAAGASPQRNPLRIPGAGMVTGACVLLGVATGPAVVFVRASRSVLDATPGAYLPFDQQLAVVGLGTLAPALLSGMAFQWAARRIIAGGRSLAIAYAIESAGALVGGAAATVAFRLGVQTLTLALWCAWFGVFAVLAAWAREKPGLAGRLGILAMALLSGLAILRLSSPLDARLTRIAHPAAVASTDTPYARITATRMGDELWVFENDALSFGGDALDSEVFATVTLLQHPRPSRVAVLSGSLEGLAREALAHGARHVDVVELDERALSLLLPLVPAPTRASLQSQRVRLHVTDARRAIEALRQVDVLLVGAPEPASAQANRYYTRDFFEQCAATLAAGGTVGLRLHASENYWTAAQRERIVAIHRALTPAFREVQLVPTPTMLVMLAGTGLATDAEALVERLVARQLTPRLATPEFLRYVYQGDRRSEAERLVRGGMAPANTDAMPTAFRLALVVWLGRFWPGLANTGLATLDLSHAPRGWTVVGAVAFFAATALLRRSRARRFAFVALIGLIGMLLESTVILHYQVTRGVLFADVGLLLTAFMAGLTSGAMSAHRWAAAWTAGRAALVCGILALACGAIGVWVASGAAANLVASCAALLAAGGFTGLLFGWASVRAPEHPPYRASRLYAADVLGGCCGAVLGGLVLIPFAGLPATALVSAALALGAVLLV